MKCLLLGLVTAVALGSVAPAQSTLVETFEGGTREGGWSYGRGNDPIEPPGGNQGRDLSFEERVGAQAAIERVYHEHREGATTAFEEAVPIAVLERKVRDYLLASKLLDEVWNTPVTPEALQRELQRIAGRTQAPDRLQEIYDALSDDPFLIQECFVRPVLVRRLVRSFFDGDPRREDRDDPTPWADWWSAMGSQFDVDSVPVVASESYELPGGLAPGSTICPPADSWIAGEYGRPEERFDHTAVWTGSEMIVWGGRRDSEELGSGGRYDPVVDTWTPISEIDAPDARFYHSAVWTGSEMIVWGGVSQSPSDFKETGGRYDPATDSWTPTSTTDAPPLHYDHSAVWTGSELIVWGRTVADPDVVLGKRYDPATDSWAPTSTEGQPSARSSHAAVWTGSEMIVWGGYQPYPVGALDTGGRYDPATDSWTETSTTDAPELGWGGTAVWTGSEMIVWGGSSLTGAMLGRGGRYDPVHDSWLATSNTDAPSPRRGHTAVWTGDEMIVWGGETIAVDFDTGGWYDPVANSWTATPTVDAPERRAMHAAVWTGEEMIVWGGMQQDQANDPVFYLDTGGRLDPLAGVWVPTATVGAPSGRRWHTAVWTGAEMIVWGGGPGFWNPRNDGGRYDPATDSWSATSLVEAPHERVHHTAVWTGDLMIVWGGVANSGGLYLAGPSEDADQDGTCDFADCDDLDDQIWATPGEVRNLVLEADGVTLSWSAPDAPGGTMPVYDVLRSPVASDFNTEAECLVTGESGTSVEDPIPPPSGGTFHYLVRARNDCTLGLGSLGTDSAGSTRAGRVCPDRSAAAGTANTTGIRLDTPVGLRSIGFEGDHARGGEGR